MRAKQSFTASEKYSCFGPFTTSTSSDADDSGVCTDRAHGCGVSSCPAAVQGEGMLHDARNLVGAIGLYCDLLAMPGVLKPEHSQYPEELRHLGARSGALIDALMRSLLTREQSKELCPAACVRAGEGERETVRQPGHTFEASGQTRAVNLRGIVERCAGLLRRVANGRALELEFGPAATAPVRVSEEDVERILVNLVRNAVAAMVHCGATGDSSSQCGTIRITLGMLASRVGGTRPWPFQRVRLSVEDSGCGMSARQVNWLLSGSRQASGSSHGIGFRVVRDLVANSDGDLQLVSAVESGTRVQIEWPVAALSARELDKGKIDECVRPIPMALCSVQSRRAGDTMTRARLEGAC